MLTALLLSATLTSAQTAILPPAIPWNGASRSLMAPAGDPWITPSERDQLRTTPRYDETFAYLRRLVAASRDLKMVSLGKSAEGRDVWMVIASTERAFTPEALRKSSKPVVFAQAGIHAGEIDGKDAGLMLLRDMTVRGTKRELLDKVNFLFVPIFNTDGHERFTKFTRINQRGPEEGGWRTNALNLNLNRDYTKADAPEMRAMIRALDTYDPDLYIDLHVTDGADYQYDITYGWNGPAGYSPEIAEWLETTLRPEVDRGLQEMGHIPGPLIFTDDPLSGIGFGQADPRLSNGYGDARHMASILVENHSLKPYDQRVLGTYVLLEHILRTVAKHPGGLAENSAISRAHQSKGPIPLVWRVPENAAAEDREILGITSRKTLSPVTGDVRMEWLGKPVTMRAPVQRATEVVTSVMRPEAYWVPPAWQEVIALLDLHGISYERTTEAQEVDVTMYRLTDPKYETPQFEGHVRVTATITPEKRRERFPAGTAVVPAMTRLGTLAALLLEPASPDSLFQWGYFHSILSPTEYVEAYIMEPMAERMLAEDPKLAEEFRQKIAADEAFRGNSRARLWWFYQRTPFYDERARLYPVGREE
ncbi:MAG TPA: M14 family metallopeptidase [Thermoanaerobaculia bacterium]|nr:M14 family metallopeptidase [Thermoanaerobaculia bacterium]